jgi:hypothetical protein
MGLSTSAVTPARVGDFVKAQLVGRHGVSLGAGFGLVLIERMLDLLVLVVSMLVAGLLLSEGSPTSSARAGGILLGVLVLALAAITNGKVRGWLAGSIASLLKLVSKRKNVDSLREKIDLVFSTWDSVFASPLTGVLTLLPFSEGVVGVTGVALLASLARVDPAIGTIAVVLDRGASALPPIGLALIGSLWRKAHSRSKG